MTPLRIRFNLFSLIIILLLLNGCARRPPKPLIQQHNPQAAEKNPIFEKMEQELVGYLGIPYKYGGTNSSGFDCSGMVWKIYRDVAGIRLPRSAGDMYNFGYPVNRGKWRFGDLLFFSTKGRGISHVGIYLGALRFQHVSSSAGTIVSSLEEDYYRKRFIGARRIIR